MKVVGFDTGTRYCGWAILEDGRLCDAGRWHLTGRFLKRLEFLASEARRLLREELPDGVAVETPFVRYPMAAIQLGKAVGIILAAGFELGIQVIEVSPAEGKKALTGSGLATKHGVREEVFHRFKRDLPTDAADAVAVAMAGLERLKVSSDTLEETK